MSDSDFVVEIAMKAEFEDGCGLSKGAGSRGVGNKKGAIAGEGALNPVVGCP